MIKDKKDLRIVFMGTPEFAVESLKELVENKYNIVGVITMPDKPAGRGYKLQQSPVKEYAVQQGLNILQPKNLKDGEFLNKLRALKVDLQIVVAFRMLPEVVWNMPPMGTFNLHASLLPQYRGAAPINWAIINGEKETGITTFFLTHEIDTGEIIFQEKLDISDDDNAESVHDKLMIKGAKLVVKTVDAILENNISTVPQNQLYKNASELKSAPKIFKDDCRIDWNKKSSELFDFIRGLSPYPAAWTELTHSDTNENIRVKIFNSEIIEGNYSTQNGIIVTDNKSYIDVEVNNGFLRVTDLQLSGKKRMKTVDFLNGFSFEENDYFK